MLNEFIERAAIEINTTLITGKNHSECLGKLKSACRQGFTARNKVTRELRFVSRKEAFEIVIASGQTVNKHGNKNILFSEDLYEDERYKDE